MINRSLLFILLASSVFAEPVWYNQRYEGWYYFQDEPAAELLRLSPEEAEETLEMEKQRFKELLALALLEPSKENVANYLRQQKFWFEQSALFSNIWGEVLRENPVLGGGIGTNDHSSIEALSVDHFLLFCFNGQDPISSPALQTARQFADKYGWVLKSLCLDGTPLPDLESEMDQGIADKLGISIAPSFFVVNPTSQTVVPLGAGPLSLETLENHLIKLFNNPNKESNDE